LNRINCYFEFSEHEDYILINSLLEDIYLAMLYRHLSSHQWTSNLGSLTLFIKSPSHTTWIWNLHAKQHTQTVRPVLQEK